MRRVPSIAPALLALAVLGALAGPTSAATFCVSDPACVSGGGIDGGSDLQAALNAAIAGLGPDTVKIGPGTFSAANGFSTRDANAAISVVGAGRGVTTLAATTAGRRVLDFGASRDATVSDLSIAIPRDGVGVFVPQHIARVAISGGTGSATGVWTQDTTVDDVSIQMPLDGSANRGIYRPNGVVTADGLTVTAHSAIVGGGGADAYRHVRIRSDGTGISLGTSLSNTMTIDDAQIRMSGSGDGIVFTTQSGGSSPAFMQARFLTIQGDGTRNSVGVASSGGGAGSTVAMTLEDSIVVGFDHALVCFDGAGPARLAVRWSAFDPSDLVDGCAARIDERTGNLNAEPALQPAPNGDLLLPAGSPAIDAGDPALTAPSPATDLAGNARLVDGNRDGTTRVDMGAFEYAPPAPPPPGGGGGSGRTGGGKPAPPVVRSFSISPRRFAPLLGRPLARARARARRGPHRGATFTYLLSAPAAVTVVVEQAVRGHRSGRGGACRVGGGSRRGRACTRWTRRATLRQIASDAVRRSIAFSGRIGRRALPAGSYRATIVAHLAGTADSLPRSVRFTLL